MEYKSSIYEQKSEKYLVSESDGEFTLGDAEERLLFYDEAEAENVLMMLNDTTDLCFVLLEE